jgi:hypothetical protein
MCRNMRWLQRIDEIGDQIIAVEIVVTVVLKIEFVEIERVIVEGIVSKVKGW